MTMEETFWKLQMLHKDIIFIIIHNIESMILALPQTWLQASNSSAPPST